MTEETKSNAGQKLALSFNPAKRLMSFLEPTVWHHMTPMAQKYNALNLGQGFPGFTPPDFVKQALADATLEKNGLNYLANQYARSAGNLMLVNKLAEIYTPRLRRTIDPQTEVIICNGATGVIFNATQSLLNPGDEVVAFEPTFDIYLAQSEMCGATLKPVPLVLEENAETKTPEWTFDMEAFRSQFNERTRLLILNTPHNPTGKVFTRAELEAIAAVVREFPNVVVIADEVYEHLVYEGEHIHFASLPDMYERTLTVSSAGKTFSCTGWKIGWAIGPKHLIQGLGIAGSWVSFSVNTPSQIAIANALTQAEKPTFGPKQDETYFKWLRDSYLTKRQILCDGLREAGFKPIQPQGSFFVMADSSDIEIPQKCFDQWPGESRDWVLARWLTSEMGVACIPPSPFYCEKNKPLAYNLLRFAFAQSDDILRQAVGRLKQLRAFVRK